MIKKLFAKKSPEKKQENVPSPDANFSATDTFQTAMQQHQAGNFSEAESFYRQILTHEPKHPDALHFLGVLLYQLGNYDTAVELINQAIAVYPTAAAYSNLAVIFQAQGKIDKAIECFRNALKYEPNNAGLYYQLGILLQTQRQLNLAADSYQKAVLINPAYGDAHFKLGNVFQALGQLDQAVTSYQKALAINPDALDAINNLGVAFQAQLKFDQAIDCFNRLLAINPNAANAYNNLGTIFQTQRKLDEAVEAFRRALAINPNYVDAHYNLGNSLQLQGNLESAIESYEKATALNPDASEAVHSLGILLLRMGSFEKGWQYCEIRYDPSIENRNTVPPNLLFPQWQGESLVGKSIVIWYEQGLGDEIQFCRYVSVLKGQGAKQITWVCKKPLKSLLKSLKDVDKVLAQEETAALGWHDYWTFALTTPLHCKTTLDTIPATVPYLYANSQQQEKIAAELDSIHEFKVGICWKGNPKHKADAERSPGISPFAPLFKLSGVKFFTLQPQTREELILNAGNSAVDRGHEINESNFDEAAALIMNMDLVIACDTSICHLAGALGKPVWIVLPLVGEWRWLLEREDSPWYPNARLFRQTTAGDWSGVFQRIETQLKQLIAGEIEIG